MVSLAAKSTVPDPDHQIAMKANRDGGNLSGKTAVAVLEAPALVLTLQILFCSLVAFTRGTDNGFFVLSTSC